MHVFPPAFSEVTDFRASSMAVSVIATTRLKTMALQQRAVIWHAEGTRHSFAEGEHCF